MTNEMAKLMNQYINAKVNLRSAKNAFRDAFDAEQANFICSIIDEEDIITAIDQIDMIADPTFDIERMKCIRLILKSGLPKNVIMKIINGNLNEEQARLIIDNYSDLNIEDLDFIINGMYNTEQIKVLINAFYNGIEPDQITFLDNSIDYEIMDVALKSLYKKDYGYPIEYIKFIASQTNVNRAHHLSCRNSFYDHIINQVLNELSSELNIDKIEYSVETRTWRIGCDLIIYLETKYDISEFIQKIQTMLPYIENIYIKEKSKELINLNKIGAVSKYNKNPKPIKTDKPKPKCYDYIYNSHSLGPVKFCGDLYEVSICNAGIYEEEDYDHIQILLKEFGY